MAASPVDKLLDQIEWTALEGDGWVTAAGHESELPYATHEGWLEVLGSRLHVYQLSDGQAVIEAESLREFFGEVGRDEVSDQPRAV